MWCSMLRHNCFLFKQWYLSHHLSCNCCTPKTPCLYTKLFFVFEKKYWSNLIYITRSVFQNDNLFIYECGFDKISFSFFCLKFQLNTVICFMVCTICRLLVLHCLAFSCPDMSQWHAWRLLLLWWYPHCLLRYSLHPTSSFYILCFLNWFFVDLVLMDIDFPHMANQ